MNLTPHFTLDELTSSDTAVRRGIDNRADTPILRNLVRLAEKLEEVRALVDRPLSVSSGYRCPDLNRWVGGSATSAHVLGLAADFVCRGMTPKALAETIRDSGIEFDQLIYEGTWVHLGLSVGKPRCEVLTARFKAGHATYLKGIV